MIRAGLSFSFVCHLRSPIYHRLDHARFLQHSNTLCHHATPQFQTLVSAFPPLVHKARQNDLHLPSVFREVDRHDQLHLDPCLMHTPAHQLL